ncbi:MAG: hypothetical protein AAB229_03325 [Candidatus Hydrogenedentota bacterium]
MAPILECLARDARFRFTIISTENSARMMKGFPREAIAYAPEFSAAPTAPPQCTVVVDPAMRYADWYKAEAEALATEAEAAVIKAGGWLANLSPDIIVGRVSPTPPIREIVLAARMLGIPTVNAEHGVSSLVRNDLDDGQSLRFHGKWAESLLFDYFGCWGEAICDVMVDHGWHRDRLFVHGCPDFDQIAEYRSGPFRKKSRSHFGIGDDVRVVALPGRPLLYTAREFPAVCLGSSKEVALWYEMLFSAISEFPDSILLVKNHPLLAGESEEALQRELVPPGVRIRWVNVEEDIWRFISAADLVVGHPGSTTDFHALALGRPLISLMLPDQTQRYMVIEEALSPCARDREGLLCHLLSPDAPPTGPLKKFLSSYIGPLDGRATERLVERLAEIVEERRSRNSLTASD